MNFEKIISDENLNNLNLDMFKDYSFNKPENGIIEQKQANIAFFARAMKEHIGWEDFPDEAKEKFIAEIERLYSDTTLRTYEEFMQDLNKAIRILPDKHASVWTSNFETIPPEFRSNVGKNVIGAKREDIVWDAKKDGIWGIGHTKDGDLVVCIANCSIPNAHLQESWADFKQAFDSVYGDGTKLSKIILDVRGNTGGEDWPLDYIARKTYGNDLNAIQTAEVRDTKLGMHFLSKHGMFKKGPSLNTQNMFVSGNREVLIDERAQYFDFNPQNGFNGRIDILVDRCVSSAAESSHNLFFHHPKARFIGENTNGMQQYQQSNIIMPCGLMVRVGVMKRNYYDEKGTIEVDGHDVDINTNGRDAFEEALINSDMSKTQRRRLYLKKLTANRGHISEAKGYMCHKQKSFDACYVKEAIDKMHTQEIKLENGLTIRYQPSEKWDAVLYMQQPFEEGEKGLFNAAANHLIEHCLNGEFDGRSETRSNMVKFGLNNFSNSDEALERLNSLSDSLSDIKLKDVELEKKRIFEEWAGTAEQSDKFKFWGGMLSPVTVEQWDKIDDTITPERGYHFINRQADYTNAFTAEEIKKHALATYGAENLTLCVNAPVSFEEFKKIIEQSKLSSIPRVNEGGALIAFRDVPSQTHYENMSISHLSFNVREKAGLKDVYKQVYKKVHHNLGHDEDIALYWAAREADKVSAQNTNWNFTITCEKEEKLKRNISETLHFLSSDKNPDSSLRLVSADILSQIKPDLVTTPEYLQQTEKSNPVLFSSFLGKGK